GEKDPPSRRRGPPDVARGKQFITDKRTQAVGIKLRYNYTFSRHKISGFAGDLTGKKSERPRHELAKRHQMHLVVAAHHRSIWTHEQRRIQRSTIRSVCHQP